MSLKRLAITKKSLALLLGLLLILTGFQSIMGQSVTRRQSTNITFVKVSSGTLSGTIKYYKPNGSAWRSDESFTLTDSSPQLITRQYDDPNLEIGRGSIVATATSGKIGAVVQIQARDSFQRLDSAYLGFSAGASSWRIPLVARRGNSINGQVNSQIIIQNTHSSSVSVAVDFYNLTNGTLVHTEPISIAANGSYEYDLEMESDLSTNWFGSAVVRVTSSGTIAAISNLFIGPSTMQTFGGFSSAAQKWYFPLFASQLSNSLNTPITVQNASGTTIPNNGIKLICIANPNSGGNNFTLQNTATVVNNASYAFNPAADTQNLIPDNWFGACRVETTGYNTVAFAQMRFINGSRAAAYEGVTAGGITIVIPLWAKRLTNSFATSVTIQNLSSNTANVTLHYIGASGTPTGCSATFYKTIPANGSIIENHRLSDEVSIPDGCLGSLRVTSDQSLTALVQLDFMTTYIGDPFMAHNSLR